MMNYTTLLAHLMRDIVARVPALSFIDMGEVLVFARFGRVRTAGPLATCHCVALPPSEPGFYFWTERGTGAITRRSEPFVVRAPVVTLHGRPVSYLISFSLPRFCNQSLAVARKARFYRRSEDHWIAKLDTVIHELYHIDPQQGGFRRMRPDAATYHGETFLGDVASMVQQYLDSGPDPLTYGFLRFSFEELEQRCGEVRATTFRSFPGFPRLYKDPWSGAVDNAFATVPVRRVVRAKRTRFTEADLSVRRFQATVTSEVDLHHVDPDGTQQLWRAIGPEMIRHAALQHGRSIAPAGPPGPGAS